VPQLPHFIRCWLTDCREILDYAEIPGYRELSWPARKALDHRALLKAVCSAQFWHIALVLVAASLLAHILTWRFDLIGWQRDLLRCSPFLFAAPGLAAMRRRLIRQLLQE
jgi:hypothetical protein